MYLVHLERSGRKSVDATRRHPPNWLPAARQNVHLRYSLQQLAVVGVFVAAGQSNVLLDLASQRFIPYGIHDADHSVPFLRIFATLAPISYY